MKTTVAGPFETPGPGPGAASGLVTAAPAWPRRVWWLVLLLGLLAGGAFLPVLGNGFVNWDDVVDFVDNPHFGGLGWPQVKWALTATHLGVYHPVAWIVYETEASVFGRGPWGFHFTSVVLHVVNTLVLFVLTVTLVARCQPQTAATRPWIVLVAAALAVALFATHPLRAEVVAWASSQMYLPLALFFMLAMLAYLRAQGKGPRRRWLCLALVLFTAALLSHAPAVSLPVLLLILDAYPLRRFSDASGRWRLRTALPVLVEKVPFFLLSVLFCGIAIYAKYGYDTVPMCKGDALAARLLVPCSCVCFYLTRTLVPWGLTTFYPSPTCVGWTMPAFALSGLAVAGLSAGAFLLRRRRPGLLAGWLGYLALLGPTMGLVWTGGYITSDHYGYLPLAGLTVLGAGVLCALDLWKWRRWLAPAGAILIAVLMVLTWQQCLIWRTSETLWTHAIRHSAASAVGAYLNLGNYLVDQQRLEEGRQRLAEAVRLDPDNVNALHGLALALGRLDRFDEAIPPLRHAISLHPDDPAVLHTLGFALSSQGKLAEAERVFARALQFKPDDPEIQNSFGLALLRQGRPADALAAFQEAVRLKPDYGDALYDLGSALTLLGRRDEAAAPLTEAVRLLPGHAEAHHNLGHVLAEQGKLGEAIAHYAEAVRLQPAKAELHNSLGLALTQQGRLDEAVAELTMALRLNKDYAMAHNHLGVALALQKRLAEACAEFREAIRLDPADAEPRQNLARVLAQNGNTRKH